MSAVDHLLNDDATRADALVRPPILPPTRTSQDELAEATGWLHNLAVGLRSDAADLHDRALQLQLDVRADEAAKRSVPDLLAELADLGFAWRDIARLVGVTVPALRKWRQGEAATGTHRRAIASLVAFTHALLRDHMVNGVASWMEMPFPGSTLTGMDVYAAGRSDLLLQYGAGILSGEALLAVFDPTGSCNTDDRFEVVKGEDGEPVIRMKAPGG